MTNPFATRLVSLNGPARDLVPVTPDDGTDLPQIAVSLYIETAGSVSLITEAGIARNVQVPDHMILPVGVRRVQATGTTASGIHALIVQ